MDIDSYDGPDGEELLRVGPEELARGYRPLRELVTHIVGALAFLTAASLMAALAPWQRHFSLATLALVLATYVAVERVKFPVAGGHAYPTMLAFVPALFVLPSPLIPIAAVSAILLGAAPGFVRGRTRWALLPAFIGDAWFSIGPVLVIVLAGAQHFAWRHWPIYVCALLAQFAFDTGWTIANLSIVERISPRVQLPRLAWVHIVDATLAASALPIAAVAQSRPALILLGLSPVVVLALFARERQQRLDAILELSTAYRGTTLLLGDIIEGDDAYTGMHSRQVVDLALGVADALSLDAAQKRNVEFGALLHDVGKIRIPKEILNKNGPLDRIEWEFVRRHTIDGEQMLRQVGGKLAEVASIVRASHERWDGGGYPDGLAAQKIPVEARIISACDAYNAMTTDRPYRSAMHPVEALEELRRGSGSQFDPQVVEALDRRIGAEFETEEAHVHPTPEARITPADAPRTLTHPGYTALSARL